MSTDTTSTFLYGAQVRANGIRQHYLRYGGQGPALVIVPGITSPAATWGFVGEYLGRRYDTYILDVRGRGLSEASPTLDYSLSACARDVATFADALDLRDYTLVGHSMGGRIGIHMARHWPQRLARLVAVDPPVSGPGRRRYPSQLPWYVDSIRMAQRGATIEDMRPYCPTWSDDDLRLRCEWLHTCDERAIVTSFDGFHQDDIHQDIPHIGVPTLFMLAERGDVVLPEDMQEIQALLPGAQTTRVPDAGHMIPWDNHAGFQDALAQFLDATTER